MDGYVLIGLGLLIAAVVFGSSRSRSVGSLEDDPVDADKIRMGVSRGWYEAKLIRVNGIPAVELSGRTADGSYYTDKFRVTEDDWNALKNEGYPVT